MARFGVYRHPEGMGYLLDIQADLLSHLNTRVVVPLLPLDVAPKPAKTLNPVFEIEGTAVSMVTQFMAAVPVRMLTSTEHRGCARRPARRDHGCGGSAVPGILTAHVPAALAAKGGSALMRPPARRAGPAGSRLRFPGQSHAARCAQARGWRRSYRNPPRPGTM